MTVLRLFRFHRRCGFTLSYALRRAIRTVLRDISLNRKLP